MEIEVADALDTDSVGRLADLLDQALELRPQVCLVDLAGCSALSAAAINALMAMHLRSGRAGVRFALRSPSEKARRNLRLARVERVFEIVTDPDG
ncbi:MAG: STAS domain-containing protein [Catenulispora sp.]|nr:STAS domain-containing protein [Catenulispora sp.]